MKLILAYFLGVIAGISFGVLAQIPFVLMLPHPRRIPSLGLLIAFVGSAAYGIVAIWIATLIFGWLGAQPDLLLILLMAGAYWINSRRRLKHADEKQYPIELSQTIGELVGVVAGGVLFIVQPL